SRYLFGIPSFRFEDVSSALGYRIPDSTQWDLFKAASFSLLPLFTYMHEVASQSKVVQLDDTTARINHLQTQFKIAASAGHKPERTGIHTTGFLGKTKSNHTLVIFKTGLHHAGEVL
ncbi:MAG: transposase, partial [Candidatus Fonsibacter sp.]